MLSGPCWNHIQACWWPLLVFKFSCSKPVRWLWLQLYNFSDIQRVPPTDPRHPSTCFVLGAGHPRFWFWTVNISKHILFETICLHEFIGGLIWGMPYRRSGCFFLLRYLCYGKFCWSKTGRGWDTGRWWDVNVWHHGWPHINGAWMSWVMRHNPFPSN